VGENQDPTQDRVTIQEAAQRLGVKEDAIRKRIQRGSLRHEKTQNGRVFVWVDTIQDTTQDTTEDAYQDASRDALLVAKDQMITALREQLEQANERDRENRRIIAALTQRIPPQLPAPEDASELTPPRPDRDAPTEASGEAQEATERQEERKGFFRRFFGL
jgi:excisionase family DNA binding protein